MLLDLADVTAKMIPSGDTEVKWVKGTAPSCSPREEYSQGFHDDATSITPQFSIFYPKLSKYCPSYMLYEWIQLMTLIWTDICEVLPQNQAFVTFVYL
jgi:hypothetical protein